MIAGHTASHYLRKRLLQYNACYAKQQIEEVAAVIYIAGQMHAICHLYSGAIVISILFMPSRPRCRNTE